MSTGAAGGVVGGIPVAPGVAGGVGGVSGVAGGVLGVSAGRVGGLSIPGAGAARPGLVEELPSGAVPGGGVAGSAGARVLSFAPDMPRRLAPGGAGCLAPGGPGRSKLGVAGFSVESETGGAVVGSLAGGTMAGGTGGTPAGTAAGGWPGGTSAGAAEGGLGASVSGAGTGVFVTKGFSSSGGGAEVCAIDRNGMASVAKANGMKRFMGVRCWGTSMIQVSVLRCGIPWGLTLIRLSGGRQSTSENKTRQGD